MALPHWVWRCRNAIVSTFADFKEQSEGWSALQSLATIIALLVSVSWTIYLTRQYRETMPRLAIKQTVSTWSLQDGSLLLRVDSIVTNTGKVRIPGVKGKMIVWRLLPTTKEQADAWAKDGIFFKCGTRVDCNTFAGLNVPDSSKKEFNINDLSSGLEPNESVPYWEYWRLDAAAKTIEVYTSIERPSRNDDPWVFDTAFNLEVGATVSSEGPNGQKGESK
jgi:hypothetical protein